ncbi:MAG: ATP-binding cassette domain-containing protein [Tetrasphaera sp.]
MTATTPVLAAREIDFTYGRGEDFRVEGWSASFPRGAVTAMTGPSGCGKSTRLYLLSLMLRIRCGVIELDGRRVDDLPDAARAQLRAQRFGFVFQDAALDASRSVIDNILEATLYRGQRAGDHRARALELLDALEVAVPPGRKPGQVSGGQGQRIATCRALLGRPDIILADEPTGNLDPASAAVVLGALRRHADDGGAVVVVTHDPGVAAWADHRLELDAHR